MPTSARSSPSPPLLHSESPALPWADSSRRHLQQQEVQELMSGSKERFMEILLVETSVEIDEISALCQGQARPGTARLQYRMAVVSARLDVLLQNRYVLAGASAFEKLTGLRNQADQLIKTHWKGLDPVKTANDKWTQLRTWMLAIEDIEDQLLQHQKCISADRRHTPGKSALEVTRSALQALIQTLRPRILTLLDSLPADAVADGILLPELADYAILQQLIHQPEEDIVSHFEQLYRLISQPGHLAAHSLIQSAEKTLEDVQSLIEMHAQHSRALQEARIEYHSGNIDKARHLLTPLKNIQFTDLEYEPIRKGISRAIRLMGQLKTERHVDAVTHARTLLKRYPGIHADSQIYRDAMSIIERRGIKRILGYACAAVVLLAGIVAFSLYFKKKSDIRDATQKTLATQPGANRPQ